MSGLRASLDDSQNSPSASLAVMAAMARFANDCYHVWRAPTGSKTAIIRDLILPGPSKMGFRVSTFDRQTLRYLFREIFARQHYYFRTENDSPIVLDCGANVGLASLYFKWLYPKAHVLAFEPDPTTFQLLKQNIMRNHLDVEAHNCALWDGNEEVDFVVDSNNPGALLMSTDNCRMKGRTIRVPARRLSDFILDSVDFLKLDVEGAEHRVLSELVQANKIRRIRQMIVEYHHRIGRRKSDLGRFLAMLENAGFEYQIHAAIYPVTSKNLYQDILIAAYQ
jgi:FkbM family methyltransferase